MELHNSSVIVWLLQGDVAVQYQTHRDLLGSSPEIIHGFQNRISTEGWGKRFLQERNEQTGLWGNGVYSPKWISTHYTLLELKNMGLNPTSSQYIDGCILLLDRMWVNHGQVNKQRYQDLCVSAMILGMCCYGDLQAPKLFEIVDYILDKQYPDGGWNCSWERGDRCSSLHTTLTVLEAFRDYEIYGYTYRIDEIKNCTIFAWEFILKKKLFRSVHSGEVIDPKMLMLSYPCRWKYDILRCMDYFASVQKSYDIRMDEALELLLQKKRKNNHWPVQQKYSGQVYFDMEQTGGDSRWNTLRVLRVIKFYMPELYNALIGNEEEQAQSCRPDGF